MLAYSRWLYSPVGFYIALHPWMQAAGFVKVGYSTNLETRLHMPSFKTCFTPEWYYHAVYECESNKEAFVLEQAVLYVLREHRVPHRELLKMEPEVVAQMTEQVASTLNIHVVRVSPEITSSYKTRDDIANTKLAQQDKRWEQEEHTHNNKDNNSYYNENEDDDSFFEHNEEEEEDSDEKYMIDIEFTENKNVGSSNVNCDNMNITDNNINNTTIDNKYNNNFIDIINHRVTENNECSKNNSFADCNSEREHKQNMSKSNMLKEEEMSASSSNSKNTTLSLSREDNLTDGRVSSLLNPYVETLDKMCNSLKRPWTAETLYSQCHVGSTPTHTDLAKEKKSKTKSKKHHYHDEDEEGEKERECDEEVEEEYDDELTFVNRDNIELLCSKIANVNEEEDQSGKMERLDTLRPYQQEAVTRVRAELQEKGKAILQMACRCGKTPVAFHIMRDILYNNNIKSSNGDDTTLSGRNNGSSNAIFSADDHVIRTNCTSLMHVKSNEETSTHKERSSSSTEEEENKSEDSSSSWCIHNTNIGSDSDSTNNSLQEIHSKRVLYLVPGLALLRQTARKLYSYGLHNIPMLLIGSDPNPVFLDDNKVLVMTTDEATIRTCILSHPCLVVLCTYYSSPLLSSLNVFGLTVFDECHRVCGSADRTNFNSLLGLPRRGWRLFLTATPTYDTPISMNNIFYFGSVAYRYYLREGIDSGFVNPFSVRIVLGKSLEKMNPYLYEAMRLVNKLLVFCRSIQHAEELYKELTEASLPRDMEPFMVLLAHSRMSGGGVNEALARFITERRCLLLNVRLFQEGVEIPDLNAVFFAAPRYSSRDIIQSICRPLNKLPNKPQSYIFLPAAFDKRKKRGDHPINLQNFSTLVPFTDALMDEDPSLFEYMIDPYNKRYDINVVGVRELKLTSERIRDFILPAIRRGVRYSAQHSDRLQRAARMPWKHAFRELQRIVTECNRYPKTNDAWVVGEMCIPMNTFYRFVRKGYALYEAHQPTYLQVYQLRDLESLPQWRRYGMHGPYPWQECIRTLEAHLAKYGCVPPLDVHKGGYIGLDATSFERLAGCLMHVNQCDGKTGLHLALERQEDLDRLCETYGLKWRKERNKRGQIKANCTTFISESYQQFKYMYEHIEEFPHFRQYLSIHFPGYPTKHERMETLQNLSEGKVPPRHEKEHMCIKRSSRGIKRSVRKAGKRVMCRVCRIKVRATEWEAHVSSASHLSEQIKLQCAATAKVESAIHKL